VLVIPALPIGLDVPFERLGEFELVALNMAVDIVRAEAAYGRAVSVNVHKFARAPAAGGA